MFSFFLNRLDSDYVKRMSKFFSLQNKDQIQTHDPQSVRHKNHLINQKPLISEFISISALDNFYIFFSI